MNLLLVEDNLPDALIIREAIKKENLAVEVQIVADGERALEIFRAAENDPQAACPQVLLLDLNLPKVDGFEVLRAVRTGVKCGHIPVLVITSSDSPSDRKEIARLEADYFRKPVSYTDFVKVGPFLRAFLKQNQLI